MSHTRPHTPEAREKIRASKTGVSNAKLLRPTQTIDNVTLYRCGRCGHYFEKHDFYPMRKTLLGISANCKPCSRFIRTKYGKDLTQKPKDQ